VWRGLLFQIIKINLTFVLCPSVNAPAVTRSATVGQATMLDGLKLLANVMRGNKIHYIFQIQYPSGNGKKATCHEYIKADAVMRAVPC
jgi:hypothetical protein